METMKYQNLRGTNMAVSSNGAQIDDVDSMFTTSCWPPSNQADYGESKLILDSTIGDIESDKLIIDSTISHQKDIESKSVEEALDGLLLSSQNMSLAELKPLPPFSGFSANININGIPGHHYQAISQQIAEENNNYTNYNEQNIVSSSTCASGNINDKTSLYDPSKLSFSDCVEADSVNHDLKFDSTDNETHIKTEIGEYDISSIEDIAAIIGSAIADTTVPNQPESEELTCSRDSWMDLDAWIDNACSDQHKNVLSSQDAISEFLIPNNNNNNNSVPNNNTISEYNRSHTSEYEKSNHNSSTLHGLLTQSNMPLLQYRLQNGPSIKQENSSTSNYNSDLVSTSSPPSNVVSTTDNLLLTVNGRFMSQYGVHIINENHRMTSPELLQNYPHTTTNVSNSSQKKPRRPPKKQSASSSTIFSTDQALGLLGKEKPVHRCSVCNRGFLNKSNIKVHLRTHTGEKPFRCDTCAKAFRQKAHLLKHQQIHKRIGRD